MKRSDEYDFQHLLKDDMEVRSHRKMELLPDGAFLIEDVLEIKGSGAMTFVMCDAWMIQLFELETGEFYFDRGGEFVRPKGKRFGIFYPPFAIIRSHVKDIRAHWAGMAATERLPREFTAAPMIFETDFTKAPKSVSDVKKILGLSYNRQSIEINPAASLLSLKAKRLIDENYLIHPSIGRIATRLGVTNAHLTRQFKRDFTLTPSAYYHQLRIAEATSRLARGEEIIKVAQDVGYNDLSRFYKQFRKSTTKTPGYCQTFKKHKPPVN
jgi:AraC-like DNA-binding protein